MSSATTMTTADDEGFTKVQQRRQRNPPEQVAAASPNGGDARRRENGNGAERPKRQLRSAKTATTNVNGSEQQPGATADSSPNQQGGRQWPNKRGSERRQPPSAPRERRPRSAPAVEGAEATGENVPSRRGGERKQRRPKEPRVDNRVTVFISGINIHDLTSVNNANLAKHYVQKRVDCLMGVLALFGPITASEVHVSDHMNDTKNYILVAYESHDHAAHAIRSLKDKHYIKELVTKTAKDVLQNLPISLAPDTRWFIDWSDKDIAAPRVTAAATKEVADKKPKKEHKEEAAVPKKAAPEPKAAKPAEPVAVVAAAVAEPVPAAAPKPKKQKKQKLATPATPVAAESAVVEASPVAQAPAPVQPPAPQPTPSELRREAEKANLNSELQYLVEQQQRVLTEITSERERCNTRAQRIVYLAEQLQRVQLEMQHLQRQLNSEEAFKKSAEERMQKLEEELHHMKDEQVRVQAHLESIENTAASAITRWVDAE